MTAFSDLRTRVGVALAGTDPYPEDSTVLVDVVDSVTPPAYMLVWGTPWVLPFTFSAHVVRLDVVCIAARMDPAPGVETLEQMIAVALNRLRAAALPEATVAPPSRYDVGGVPYLAARLTLEVRVPVPDPATIP